MRKLAAFIMSSFLLFGTVACGSDTSSKEESSVEETSSATTVSVEATSLSETSEDETEMRAYWVSYLDLQTKLQNQTEEAAKAHLDEIIQNVADSGGNTIFLQVRPYSDALYESEFFPASHIASGTQGKSYSFDILEYVTTEAHKNNVKVQAWINPFRVKDSNRPPELSADNPAKKWLDEGSRNVIEVDDGIYYNPASEEAQALIVSGVEEIVKNYDVDGVQFDDYFYPTTDASFDDVEYKAYQLEGGALTLSKWRQENVNTLVKSVYSIIKASAPDVQFGISPMADIEKNYTEQYADVKTWAATSGYVDYLMPQIYFGFLHATVPYQETLDSWNALTEQGPVKLMVGLAVYKIGEEDQWAGDAGKQEWTDESGTILARQIEAARKEESYGGVGFYRYDSVFNPADGVKSIIETEMKNVEALSDW